MNFTERARRRGMPGAPRTLALAIAFAALVGLPTAAPSPVAAASVTDAEALVVSWVNQARAAKGLRPLVRWTTLESIAGKRATRMAQTNTLSHTIAGSLKSQVNAAGVKWYRYGEVIAWNNAGWPVDSARMLFLSWKKSSSHWKLLMSSSFNYIGVGLALRSSNHRTYGSVVMSESPDHTKPRASMSTASRSGDDIRFTWTGYDVRLQTRTAGLRDFDVQYRIGSGAWKTIRNDTKSTSITLRDRVGGRTYYLRVRATDKRGNVGAWSSAKKIWVP